MDLLFWRINRNEQRIAKFQWFLYKWFRIKRKYPCGQNKKSAFLYCALPMSKEHSYVINDGDRHEVICKVCGSLHMMSNEYINPDMLDYEWKEI